MRKIVVLSICCMLLMIFIPTTTSENINNESGPELETHIVTGFGRRAVYIDVENIGDTIAHNVTLTQVTTSNNVILNFQAATCWSVDLIPGEDYWLDPNNKVFGFGIFTISMTVECDEGASSTSSVTGLIFGPLFFIP